MLIVELKGCFFTADYRDGQVYSGGKKYPAGHFTVQLMNQYYVQDTAARIAVYQDAANGHVLDQLRDGYLNIPDFVRAGELTGWALQALPQLSPFEQIDTEALRQELSTLFTEEVGREIRSYFRYRGQIAEIREDEVAVGTVDRRIDRAYLRAVEKRIDRVCEILRFFDGLSEDIHEAHRFLGVFANRLEEPTRLDEAHLLPLALEIIGPRQNPYSAQYVAAPKTSRSKGVSLSRRLSFDRFAAFILTDFFEGLHYGHYLRRCPICGNYFLMQSARRQLYCSLGYAPKRFRGKRLTCRKYAAAIRRKELAADDPIIDLYNRRCSAIRAEKSQGTITPAFAETVRLLAQDRKFRALREETYAAGQYVPDLAREKLYADAKARECP